MPKGRQRQMFYATATKQVNHGDPTCEGGAGTANAVPGIAVKQKAVSHTAALSTHKVIGIGEKFAIISKGVVEVTTVAGFAKGDPVYIIPATNVLTETSTSNVKFGRVVEIAGERGTPTGKVRIDLDDKNF